MSEEVKNKGGRPKVDNPRTKVLNIRLTPGELQQVQHLANLARMSPSAFVRSNLLAWIQSKK